MSVGFTVERRFRVQHGQHGRTSVARPQVSEVPSRQIPRVARLMALAIRFDKLLKDKVVADQAELARLGRVTRARLTQIMNLLTLAPDIQEQLLHLSSLHSGRDAVSERHLRPIAAKCSWRRQRREWTTLMRMD